MGSHGDSISHESSDWKSRARKHREKQKSRIPAEWQLDDISESVLADPRNTITLVEQRLSAEEREITSTSQGLRSLQSAIHSRKYTAVQVCSAFCHRAALLQQLTKCLTEIFFESALKRAQELDDHLERTGEIVGPLHGIPLSVKDNHDVEGQDTTLGWVAMVGKPAPKDHPGVAQYRRLGAVLYCKTNLPQSMMMSDSYNHLYGQSVNSLDRRFISGGSSGGEAALVAAGGSVIGVGTDIGGSVRIPAVLQGLYGLSPTAGRFPNRESIKGSKYIVPPVAGPIARDIDTIELFMQNYLGSEPWDADPGIFPIPWRTDAVKSMSTRKLRIGYLTDDGAVRPHPPCTRAVHSVCQKLTDIGHEVVNWKKHGQELNKRAYDLWLRAVLADGGDRMKVFTDMIGEPLIEGMLVGKPKDKLTLEQRGALADEIFDLQKEYLAAWKSENLDVLIMPVTQWVALRPKAWVKADMYVGYTSLCNLLNWTGLAIPAIKVDKSVDQPSEDWVNYKANSFSDQFNKDGYDVEAFDGLPVGVQIVTGRFGEEKAIGLARVLAGLRHCKN